MYLLACFLMQGSPYCCKPGRRGPPRSKEINNVHTVRIDYFSTLLIRLLVTRNTMAATTRVEPST